MVRGVPFYVSYLTPILIIVAVNVIVLTIVLRTLFRKSNLTKNKSMDAFTKARIATACSILMGITWILGLFAIEELKLTFQILFCVFNSSQGLLIFIFYCARNTEVQKEWKRCCGFGTEDVYSSSGTARKRLSTGEREAMKKSLESDKKSRTSEKLSRYKSYHVVAEPERSSQNDVSVQSHYRANPESTVDSPEKNPDLTVKQDNSNTSELTTGAEQILTEASDKVIQLLPGLNPYNELKYFINRECAYESLTITLSDDELGELENSIPEIVGDGNTNKEKRE